MVSASLSAGYLSDIIRGFYSDKPVLQVLGSKRIGAEENIRYRLVVSDGESFTSHAVLSKILNFYVEDNQLTDKTIIRVEHYSNIYMPQGNTIVIMGLSVLHPGVEVTSVIGDPQNLIDEGGQATVHSICVKTPKDCSFVLSTNISESDNFELCKPKEDFDHRIIYPIKDLQAYQKKGTIKAIVASKSSIRSLSSCRGMVKGFDMHLMDDTGEIMAICSGDVVDKYYKMIQVDKTYLMSKYAVQEINKSSGDCEVILTSETVIVEWFSDKNSVPSVKYNLVPLSQIPNMVTGSAVDILGICHDVGDCNKLYSNFSGTTISRRLITLVDATLATVTLTLWGEYAEHFDGASQPVVLVTEGKISGYGGRKSVSLPTFGSLKIDPDIYEAHQLRRWYENDI